ncbi:MAG: S-methyl-5'-thioinosine phosphorylase [Pseudomonadota bacterium]|nr:S-methyl-5'-thioinosine phosphorylase [Pseudomonadota bacterium]
MLAIIGGSGLSQLANLQITRRQVVRTPYGEPSSPATFGLLGGVEIVFLARHGYGHTLAPHEINYRANVWALRELGAGEVIAVNSVGSIAPHLAPGSLVVPDNIIDYTSGRPLTFFEGADQPVTHVDFTWPFSAAVRAALLASARDAGLAAHDGGVYAATNGPRLESAAEIERLARDGAAMVGMTGMPEAALARELDLPYAMLALAVNWAAGRGDSADKVVLADIATILDEGMVRVRRVIERRAGQLAG